MKKPALFLDRDGVINSDHGYVHTPDTFEFIDGIFELVASANRAGYLVVVATNQAGIGRGYYSETQFHTLTDWMKERFAEKGGQINAVYYCPYHPDHGISEYRRESSLRKPSPGMLLQAQRELNIDLSESVLVGDKLSDMYAGKSVGIKYLLLLDADSKGTFFRSIKKLNEVLPFLSDINISAGE
jgi:D-glycero-D-manno-heptose 1,7-bisphosphate phosphatase